jgi:glutamate-1-semialdehyde 2,1-aminomutase
MNCIPPNEGFLQGLRKICDDYGTVLIFDEVMTGFRVALGGAQEVYDVVPDLTALGKIIGGGLPVAAFGGKREIMSQIAPLGPVYQAGTLSGNPLSMASGIAMLSALESDKSFYEKLGRRAFDLVEGIVSEAKSYNIPMTYNYVGGMFGLFFSSEEKVSNFSQASSCNIELFKKFFNGMLKKGIYLAPSAYEAGFLSIAHSDEDITKTIETASSVFSSL